MLQIILVQRILHSISRLDEKKHCIKCPGCSEDRPVDTLNWTIPSTCEKCGTTGGMEDKEQMDKYKELYELLKMQGSDEMSDINYDYLSTWCAGRMSSVYGVT